jgi:hypothetical protein
LEFLTKKHGAKVQERTLELAADTDAKKIRQAYWAAELGARTQWQNTVAQIFSSISGAFAAGTNIALGAGSDVDYSHSMTYSQQVSRSYGVDVNVSADDPGGIDLTPTLTAAPEYVTW